MISYSKMPLATSWLGWFLVRPKIHLFNFFFYLDGVRPPTFGVTKMYKDNVTQNAGDGGRGMATQCWPKEKGGFYQFVSSFSNHTQWKF